MGKGMCEFKELKEKLDVFSLKKLFRESGGFRGDILVVLCAS